MRRIEWAQSIGLESIPGPTRHFFFQIKGIVEMHFATQKQKQMEPLLPSQPPPSCISDTLPNDIIYRILMKLPVKSLLRFRCVCKNWESIIRSKAFMLSYSFSRPQRYIFVHFLQDSSMASHKRQPCTIFCESSFSVISELEIPSTFGDPSHNPVGRIAIGSCHGLLCITNFRDFGRELYLWNPSIRKHKLLTTTSLFTGKFSQRFKHQKTSTIVGLGFDSKTKDYKILRIAHFNWKSRRSKSKPPPQAEIYSLNTDSWRSLELPDHLTKRFITTPSWNYAYIYGAFHWLAKLVDENGNRYSSILKFDISEERFGEVNLPNDYLNGINGITQRLVVFRGLLALIICGENLPYDGGRVCHIWMMNGSCWIKERVEFARVRWHSGCIGDHLVLAEGCRRVSLLHPQTLEEKVVEVPPPASVHGFSESLALLSTMMRPTSRVYIV